jgi:hypothetical protein
MTGSIATLRIGTGPGPEGEHSVRPSTGCCGLPYMGPMLSLTAAKRVLLRPAGDV